MSTADTLSRAPLQNLTAADTKLQEDCDAYVALQTVNIPATESRLNQIRHSLDLPTAVHMVGQTESQARLNSTYQLHLKEVHDGLLLRGSRFNISSSMTPEILRCLHRGHQGTTKCHKSAKESIWSPGLGKQISMRYSLVKSVVNLVVNL